MTARALRRCTLAATLLPLVTLLSSGCKDATTATSPTATSPVTETFSAQFIPGGSAARAFTAASSGAVSITLTQVGPPADAVVGVGIGIPQSGGSGCYVSQAVVTGAASTPQLTAQVDAGTYCVRVYDTGKLTALVSFTLTIVRP